MLKLYNNTYCPGLNLNLFNKSFKSKCSSFLKNLNPINCLRPQVRESSTDDLRAAPKPEYVHSGQHRQLLLDPANQEVFRNNPLCKIDFKTSKLIPITPEEHIKRRESIRRHLDPRIFLFSDFLNDEMRQERQDQTELEKAPEDKWRQEELGNGVQFNLRHTETGSQTSRQASKVVKETNAPRDDRPALMKEGIREGWVKSEASRIDNSGSNGQVNVQPPPSQRKQDIYSSLNSGHGPLETGERTEHVHEQPNGARQTGQGQNGKKPQKPSWRRIDYYNSFGSFNNR